MICSRAVRKQAAWRVLAVATLVAATACSSGKQKATPSATVPTAPAQTTTTDPYAVPTVIDAAYVNRVLAGLDAVVGDVARLMLQTRSIPPDAIERYRSIYAMADLLQQKIDLLQEDVRRNFADYKTPPGNPVTTVEQILSARADCVFARVSRDYSQIARTPAPTPSELWVVLVRRDSTSDSVEYNRTRWALGYDGYEPGRRAPGDPCAPR